MNVLVVDDEQLVCWFLDRALRKWGHEVLTVSSVREAIQALGNKRFDLVITDLKMPEGNGTTLLKQMRDLTTGTQVIVCSAFISPEMAEDFKGKGIVTLRKPFRLAELQDAVQSAGGLP